MKKNFLAAALLSTISLVSFAQAPVDKHDKAMSDAPKHEKAMNEEPKHEKAMKGSEKHSQKHHNKKPSGSADTK